MHLKIRVGFLSVSLMSLLAGSVAPLCAQSLADLSRQEEQRRKAVKQPAKVYTNKDLGQVPPAPVPPATALPPAPPAGVKSDQAKDADKDKDDKEKAPDQPAGSVKDRAYWSDRLKTLQSQLDRDQIYVEALHNRISGLTDFITRGDATQRPLIERDLQKAVAELDRLTLAVVNDKKALVDLEDEARRANVPPGWLR
jgi:hypothetical protein